jgi:hypothetical protein
MKMPTFTPDQSYRNLIVEILKWQKREWRLEEEKTSSYAILRDKIVQLLSSFLVEQIKLDETPLQPVIQRKMIPLPPLETDRHLVPFLTFTYDGRGCSDSCCRMYILMLGFNQNPGGRNQIYGVGFRVESPESNCQQNANGVGRHDFYHAQFISNLNRYGWPEFYRTFPHLPQSQPSFPLWATQPAEALLNLVLTLYGSKYYLEFVRSIPSQILQPLSNEFKQLNARLLRR